MAQLAVGDPAPSFRGVDHQDQVVSSEELRGRRWILYFYPKDNTSGCTAEACSLRDGYAELRRMGFEVIGVSPDGAASHRKFIEQWALPFRLIVDSDHQIASAYGAWGDKKLYGRTYQGILRKTFLVDETGRISGIIDKVDTKNHFVQLSDYITKNNLLKTQ